MSEATSKRKFDFGTHWVSRQVAGDLFGRPTSPLVNSVVKFGLLWDVFAAAYVATQWEHLSLQFLFASALGLLWVNVAAYLVWSYDEVVLPQFFERFSTICTNEDEVARLAEKYTRYYANPHYLSCVFWAVALVAVAWAGTPVLRANGMTGSGEVFLWLTYLYGIHIGGVLGGPGFAGPLTTVLLIRDAAALDFEIQPLHPDQLGGLSTVGFISIRTTLLYSSGSLFLPLLFELSTTPLRRSVLFLFGSVYVVTIVVSFVYPTMVINRKAAEVQEEVLEQLRTEYSRLGTEIDTESDDPLADVNRRLQQQQVRSRYDDYNNVRLYPFEIDTLIQLAGSVLLPVVFLFLELYVDSAII